MVTPFRDVNAAAWHDFAGVTTGRTIEVICDASDGEEWWKGGDLNRIAEPVLIARGTDNGQVVRPVIPARWERRPSGPAR